MTRVFADSWFFFAFLDATHLRHPEVVEFLRDYDGELVTSWWVLLEVADGMAGTAGRGRFLEFLATLAKAPSTYILPIDPQDLEGAFKLYHEQSHRRWSLTDCTSFVIMRRERVTRALTGDDRFREAGFEILFPKR